MTIRIESLLVAIVLTMSLSGCSGQKKKSEEAKSYPTMVVSKSDQMIDVSYAAMLSGVQTVEIRPQVSGTITHIYINEGDVVKKGQTLFVIDQVPYQSAYDIAKANVRIAQAKLATARMTAHENSILANEGAISNFEVTTSENDRAQAEGSLSLALAEEIKARNDLSYTSVKSPVTGTASMIPYRVGALVSSSIAEPLVTVSDDSQIHAYFSMSENMMLDMVEHYGSLKNAIDSGIVVGLRLSNGRDYAHEGKINAISGTINKSTGAVSLRAVFPNPEHLLKDGGSASVVMHNQFKDCIVIPQSATYELQDKIFVFKVTNHKAVSAKIEVADANNGQDYVVMSGLAVGDTIISEGAGLVREGTLVKQ